MCHHTTVRSNPSFLNFEPGKADFKPNIYRFREPACLCKVCQDEKFWNEGPYSDCPHCLEEENAIEAIERKYNYLPGDKAIEEDFF